MKVRIHSTLRHIAIVVACFFSLVGASLAASETPTISDSNKDEVIFTFGGEINKPFVRYVASLTNLPKPKICFLPTASADNQGAIIRWYQLCHDLPVEPYVLSVWVNSYYAPESFDEILSKMDAIIVGGGNALNMMALWKAQGIDSALLKSLKRGTVLAGGSAGAICWFEGGVSDSRPKQLSFVDGLSFLGFSTCPHFRNEPGRRELYKDLILNNKVKPGYAIDEQAGVLFRNGKYVKSVSLNSDNQTFYISVIDGKILEEKLSFELIK